MSVLDSFLVVSFEFFHKQYDMNIKNKQTNRAE